MVKTMTLSFITCCGYPSVSSKRYCILFGVFVLAGMMAVQQWYLQVPLETMFRFLPATMSPRLRNQPNCSAISSKEEFRRRLPRLVRRNAKGISSAKTSWSSTNQTCTHGRSTCQTMKITIQGGPLPTVYVITPTYTRLTQEADLLRLCYTLMHVMQVHWIVVEDSKNKTAVVSKVLANCKGPSITHLVAKTTSKSHHRGVEQRNVGLAWLRGCVLPGPLAGGIYFADDDNTYDIKVFEAVRWTQIVSMWLVGIVGGSLWEGPVCSNGKVKGWLGSFAQNRRFPVDMAAFSVGINFFLSHPQSKFSDSWPTGYLETKFLETLNISMDELKPEPDMNCSKILAWHTQTKSPRSMKTPRQKNMTVNRSRPK